MAKNIQSPQPSPVAPRVQADSYLTLHYRLAGPDGDIITTFGGRPSTLSMGSGELSAGVEQYLLGLQEGARQTFEIPAGVAFGPHNPDLRQWVARSLLAELSVPEAKTFKVGDIVILPAPEGMAQRTGMVVGLSGRAVHFDFNHPLAGQAVTFEVQLIGVL